jgi:hypothetical protein
MRATDRPSNGECEPNASNEPGSFSTPTADNGDTTLKKKNLLTKVNRFFNGKKRSSDSQS